MSNERLTSRTRGDAKLLVDLMACTSAHELNDLWRDACRLMRRMSDEDAEDFIEDVHDVASDVVDRFYDAACRDRGAGKNLGVLQMKDDGLE